MSAATAQALTVIGIACAITVALRALPFLAMRTLKENHYLAFLGRVMPVGVMALLVAYTFRNLDVTTAPWGLPELGLAALAAVLYWRTRALLVSLALPLVVYIVLASTVLPHPMGT